MMKRFYLFLPLLLMTVIAANAQKQCWTINPDTKGIEMILTNEYRPIPSSIIAEGLGAWAGAGDRGDAAMNAHGATRYLLARGDIDEAKELWPFIKWCLEYTRRQLNDAGVPRSDRDELEGRFPSGEANLCTATLFTFYTFFTLSTWSRVSRAESYVSWPVKRRFPLSLTMCCIFVVSLTMRAFGCARTSKTPLMFRPRMGIDNHGRCVA